MLTDTLTQTYLIWDALLKHINQKSRNHPHYEYWKAMAEGASNLTPFTKHLEKLRQVLTKAKKNVEVTDANGVPRRTKGTMLIFGPPLPNAAKDQYRL
jgi:hypothetical protein